MQSTWDYKYACLRHCAFGLQVYLVDYGLAYRYLPDGVHKEYKEDPKRCHDGTIEFTSIDAHKGTCKYNLLSVVINQVARCFLLIHKKYI